MSRQRIWHIRAAQVVLAPAPTNARWSSRQRPPRHHARLRGPHLPQPLRRRRRVAGVVISTTNDSAYALAADLRAAGIGVAAVVDARPQLSATAAAAAAAARGC